MNRKLQLVILAFLGLSLAACSGKKDTVVIDDGASNGDVTSAIDSANAFDTGLSTSELEALGIIGDPLNYKTVYFEYNSTAIDRRSEVIAKAHARELARRGGVAITLEGHADERGTRDYNLALGERRAQAVANLMTATGAGSSSFNNVSYGEERPVDASHNDSAWQKNRRVEIVY